MKKGYEDLWITVNILLTPSNGQDAVERGFSVDKEVPVPHL